MAEQYHYKNYLDVKYGFLELIDVPSLATAVQDQWLNQTLCRVDECVIRLGVVQGEYHWHKHDEEDEFFFVLQGRLLIDLEGKSVMLDPHQGFTVPKGLIHRPRAPERTVILMVERASIQPTGN